MRAILYALLLCSTVSASAIAAKRPVSPGTSSPDVLYVRVTNKGVHELRVADDDGTGAVTLYSSGNGIRADFGPAQQIAVWDGTTLKLLNYEVGPNGVQTTGSRTLTSTVGELFNVVPIFAFSPAGDRIVWFHEDEKTIHVTDVSTGADSVLHTVGTWVASLTITRDASTIVYSESVGGSFTDWALKALPIGGGTAVDMNIGGNILGVEAGHTDNRLLLTKQIVGTGRYLELIPDGATSGARLADGWDGDLACTDDRAIYRVPSGRRGWTILIHDVDSGTPSIVDDGSFHSAKFNPNC